MTATTRRRLRTAAATTTLAVMAVLSTLARRRRSPAGATSYVPVTGEGSSWSAGALDQWIADVHADGMQINYTANGSTTGRQDFINGQTDFAASDIPFQTDPGDGSAPSTPRPVATPTCRSPPAARSSCTTSRSTASG